MSFVKIRKFPASLSLRLTFWSVIVFSICLALILAAFYFFAQSYLFRAADAAIIYELDEASNTFKNKGYQGLKDLIKEEAVEFDPHNYFFRLIDRSGNEIVSSDLENWSGIEVDKLNQTTLHGKGSSETIELLNHAGHIRLLWRTIGEQILQAAVRLQNEMEILSLYKVLLPTTWLIIVILATATSHFMIREAMRRVDEMTNLAQSISAEHLSTRLPSGKYDDEISRLSETFNQMLERIERLVIGMKNVTADLAHDIKIPITRIRSRAELTLNSVPAADEQYSVAGNTLEECDRLLELINSMLEISEAESKVTKLQKQPIDIDELLKTALELFDPVADQKGVKLEFNSCGKIIINGDLSKLQRALSNIIDNAIKYTSAGGIIKVTIEKGKDGTILVQVQDTGIGINAKDLPFIYERFYRADPSRSSDGNGLGLTMSRAFIEAHGGQIDIKSKENQGTVVSVSLPV